MKVTYYALEMTHYTGGGDPYIASGPAFKMQSDAIAIHNRIMDRRRGGLDSKSKVIEVTLVIHESVSEYDQAVKSSIRATALGKLTDTEKEALGL